MKAHEYCKSLGIKGANCDCWNFGVKQKKIP